MWWCPSGVLFPLPTRYILWFSSQLFHWWNIQKRRRQAWIWDLCSNMTAHYIFWHSPLTSLYFIKYDMSLIKKTWMDHLHKGLRKILHWKQQIPWLLSSDIQSSWCLAKYNAFPLKILSPCIWHISLLCIICGSASIVSISVFSNHPIYRSKITMSISNTCSRK